MDFIWDFPLISIRSSTDVSMARYDSNSKLNCFSWIAVPPSPQLEVIIESVCSCSHCRLWNCSMREDICSQYIASLQNCNLCASNSSLICSFSLFLVLLVDNSTSSISWSLPLTENRSYSQPTVLALFSLSSGFEESLTSLGMSCSTNSKEQHGKWRIHGIKSTLQSFKS